MRSKVIFVKQTIKFLFLLITLSIAVAGAHYFCFFVSAFTTLHREYSNTKTVIDECCPQKFWTITPEAMHTKCFVVTSNCPFSQKIFASRGKEKFYFTFESIYFVLVNIVILNCSDVYEYT